LKAGVVAVEGTGRIHEPREGPLGGALRVGWEWHGVVSFDGGVLVEGPLGVEHDAEEENRVAESREDRHSALLSTLRLEANS
jgi:hypothetical protein